MMKERDYPASAMGCHSKSNGEIGNVAATNPKDRTCHPCAGAEGLSMPT